MVDWTEESERSDTSRQVEERARSARVKGLEVEEEEEEVTDLRILRIWASDLRRFLKGWDAELESESARRRFFLSAMEMDCGGKILK